MFVGKVLVAVMVALVSMSVQKESACVLILCKNTHLESLRDTIAAFEERFNKRFQYPYVLLNDAEFDENFKTGFQTMTQAEVSFGLVPKEHWSFPAWVDPGKARERMDAMAREGVLYGGMESYRHMCRFFSGFFYKHPLVQKYRYYWRVEPDTLLHCTIDYDVFEYMSTNRKKYGFVISLHEYPGTIKSLWKTVQNFVSTTNTNFKQGQAWSIFAKENLKRFVTDEMFTHYNMCHFWSNFEIGDFSFFRSPLYESFFGFLDRSGGFFYERWGDAPVHSIAASLFLDRSEIHFFEDIGYTHPPFTHCPKLSLQKTPCSCDAAKSVDLLMPACTNLYRAIDLFEKPPQAQAS
ncbi:alpha 1,2-mannosyltransferase [Nematocida displodere]|uniref:Alpha 1,2-mannosyltransferase n=1 Tax=Nematocida displodere TaxID=1805483 RepID=A0A177EC06_9MICR|nr:alpha 1,2-mannosyltransferase [Nematocida displodere]